MIRGICDTAMDKAKNAYAYFAAMGVLEPENKYLDGVLDGMSILLKYFGLFSEVQNGVFDKIEGVIK